VAYFAAMLARTSDGWIVSDRDLDEIDDLEGLADSMRKASVDDEPVLLFVEQEDMWFAVVRVDGEDDPRVFVSDAAAAARSSYGDMLLADIDGSGLADEDVDTEYSEDDEPEPYPASEPVGDIEILADLGTLPDDLLDLCGEGLMPTDALTAIAERAGFAEELEAVR
jgi:putative tRNA adenosine deaminase-associated protein